MHWYSSQLLCAVTIFGQVSLNFTLGLGLASLGIGDREIQTILLPELTQMH